MKKPAAEADYQRLTASYNAAVIAGNEELIVRALQQPIPESVLRSAHLHSRLRRSRGNMLCRIGLNEVAEGEYGLGFYDCPTAGKGDYLLDWGMAAFAGLFADVPSERTAAMARCLEVLGLADRHAAEVPDPRYLMASIASIRAFLLVYAGDAAGAREQLARIEPPQLSGKTGGDLLASYFTQLPKALFATVELDDPDLLARLSRTMLLAEEEQFVGTVRMTSGEQFMYMLGIRLDVPKFRDSWQILLEFAHRLFPKYPRLRRFRSLLSTGAGPDELAAFIDGRL